MFIMIPGARELPLSTVEKSKAINQKPPKCRPKLPLLAFERLVTIDEVDQHRVENFQSSFWHDCMPSRTCTYSISILSPTRLRKSKMCRWFPRDELRKIPSASLSSRGDKTCRPQAQVETLLLSITTSPVSVAAYSPVAESWSLFNCSKLQPKL